jgi:phosphoglycerate kinase
MKYVDQINIENKTVLMRTDFNVPLNEQGQVADDTRIKLALPSINYILSKNAKLIICSHMGRPKGKFSPALSLKPVATRLEDLLGRKVKLAPGSIGKDVSKLVSELEPRQILLLENLRFHPEEENNDENFAKELASYADVYVNEAFAVDHRDSASLVAITKNFGLKAAGFGLKKELDYFNQALSAPKSPFVAIFGGAKISTKMSAIRYVGKKADRLIIGGAMANTFFVAQGLNLGKSLYEPEEVAAAKEIEAELKGTGCELVLPIDVIVADKLESGVKTEAVSIDAVSNNKMILDIGPKTVELFQNKLKDAETIVWNGPMGAFETTEFSEGTYSIVDALVHSSALTVVGGGDTDLALHNRHAFDKVSYVSTGGGAFLKLLEGKSLPGVLALD